MAQASQELQQLYSDVVIVAHNSGRLSQQHEQIVLARSKDGVFVGGRIPQHVVL